ncbi:MAG: hypothetical protein ABIY55_20680, partial [Kofleriaceae bacterium]
MMITARTARTVLALGLAAASACSGHGATSPGDGGSGDDSGGAAPDGGAPGVDGGAGTDAAS